MYYFFILICSLNLFSQVPNNSSPYSAVYNHLKYLQEDSYLPNKAAESFNFNDKAKAKDYAIKLKKYLDATGKYVVEDLLPKNSNYIDSASGLHICYLFEDDKDIYVEKQNGKWYYSKHTTDLIPKLYSSISSSNIDGIINSLPPVFSSTFLEIALWKYIGLVLFLIIGFLLHFIIKKILNKYLLFIINKFTKGQVLLHPISHASSPFSLCLTIFIFSNFLVYLQLPIELTKNLNSLIKFSYPFLLTIVFYRVTDLISDIFEVIATKTKSTTDDKLIPLVRMTIKIVVVVVGSFYIVDSFGINYTPLLAGASIGGLALALAAQETVRNFFGSITIFTDKPFEIGDYIMFDNSEGNVEEVGVRSTRVRTFYDSVISIPNGKIADMKIDNMGLRKIRRYKTTLNLSFDTPVEKAELFVSKMKDWVEKSALTTKKDNEISIYDISNSSIQILVYIFFDVDNWTDELKGRQAFIVESFRVANELEIKFAYPTQSIKIEEIKSTDFLNKDFNA